MKTILSIKEAADMLGVTIPTLRNWDKNGQFEAVKTIGKHRRYKLEEVQKLLNNV